MGSYAGHIRFGFASIVTEGNMSLMWLVYEVGEEAGSSQQKAIKK